ncbi:MAG: hypothetical protein ACRC33_06895, partial [Gemmataceae bacterium]
PAPPALDELDLSGNPLLGEAIPVLAGWPGLRRLRTLRLAAVYFPQSAFDALTASPHLDRIEVLDVSGSAPFAAAVRPLRDRFGDRLIL